MKNKAGVTDSTDSMNVGMLKSSFGLHKLIVITDECRDR